MGPARVPILTKLRMPVGGAGVSNGGQSPVARGKQPRPSNKVPNFLLSGQGSETV